MQKSYSRLCLYLVSYISNIITSQSCVQDMQTSDTNWLDPMQLCSHYRSPIHCSSWFYKDACFLGRPIAFRCTHRTHKFLLCVQDLCARLSANYPHTVPARVSTEGAHQLTDISACEKSSLFFCKLGEMQFVLTCHLPLALCLCLPQNTFLGSNTSAPVIFTPASVLVDAEHLGGWL